jgi:hypothetical protein
MTRGLTRKPSDKRGTDTWIKKAGFFYLIYRARKGTRVAVPFWFLRAHGLEGAQPRFIHHLREKTKAQQIEGPWWRGPPRARGADARGRFLRAWVESNYTHVPLSEKDTGTKLDALFGAYTSANPPVGVAPTRGSWGKPAFREDAGLGVSWYRAAQEQRLHREWVVPAPLKQNGPVFCFLLYRVAARQNR